MVEDKIGWMVSYLFGLESMAYLTTGLVDAGIDGLLGRVGDGARSPGPSSPGTRPTAPCSSRAARATCATEPYEQIMRDIRIFPIFEGANDVLRSFVALSVLKPLGDELEAARRRRPRATRSARSAPGPATSAAASSARCAPTGHAGAPRAARLADPVADQVKRLRSVSEGLLRAHGKEIVDQGDAPQAPGRRALPTSTRRSPSCRA